MLYALLSSVLRDHKPRNRLIAFSEKSPVVTDRGETERGKIKDASEVSPCFYRKNNGYSLTASYLFRRYLSRQGLTSEAFFIMFETFIKKPCKHCPYRKDVKPFLTQSRQEELAFAAQNPYNTFPCHKTITHDEDGEQTFGDTKECAGFLTLRAAENGEECLPKGFEPSYDIVFSDSWEMAGAIENWEDQ